MTRDTPLVPNRILVALDTSSRGRAALEAAVRLAVNTSAELQGLFVEDEDLVRLASLPFASEVDLASARFRDLQTVNMERVLHAAAEEAQRAFANALAGVNLQWTFRIVRGSVSKASLAAAADVGLLVIGQPGRFPRIMTTDFRPTGNGRRMVVVFDGSASAFRSLDIAVRLSTASPDPLSVLVLASDGDAVTQQCLTWLRQQDVRAQVDQVLNASEDALVDYVRKWPPGVLLLNRDAEVLSDAVVGRLVNELRGPLILS